MGSYGSQYAQHTTYPPTTLLFKQETCWSLIFCQILLQPVHHSKHLQRLSIPVNHTSTQKANPNGFIPGFVPPLQLPKAARVCLPHHTQTRGINSHFVALGRCPQPSVRGRTTRNPLLSHQNQQQKPGKNKKKNQGRRKKPHHLGPSTKGAQLHPSPLPHQLMLRGARGRLLLPGAVSPCVPVPEAGAQSLLLRLPQDAQPHTKAQPRYRRSSPAIAVAWRRRRRHTR